MKAAGPAKGSSIPIGLNDSSAIIGNTNDPEYASTEGGMFMYCQGELAPFQLLAPKGWQIYTIDAINNNGQVVGTAYMTTTPGIAQIQPVLLTPIPPP